MVASTRRTPAATPLSPIILNKPISPVRLTCVPPHNSRLEPISKTRTSSPYFSPNSIMAPVFCADSISITRAWVAALLKISAFTIASTLAISASVIGALCTKSKRVLSESTKLPFCCTCSPNISRKALCIKCVAEWLRMVSARDAISTLALTVSPTLSEPVFNTPWCPNTAAWIFCVSSTAKMPLSDFNAPLSPIWPPDSA